jgi:hypothetical protein
VTLRDMAQGTEEKADIEALVAAITARLLA